MGAMSIKVSVILPSLNVAEYIEECIESVINQTLSDMEIICVDAGSDDGTRQIIEKYAGEDDRISVIDSKVRSYGYQVNVGIAAAKGKYVAVLETDDFALKDMYEKLYIKAETYSLDYVMADFKFFYDDANKRVYSDREVFKNIPKMYGRILSMHDHAQIYDFNESTLWRGIYSKKFIVDNKITLNETSGAAYQDICFMHRVRMKAQRSMYINEYGYCYRTDRDNSSVNSVKGLQYAGYEYRCLLENDDIPDEYMGKIYYMMAEALLWESAGMLSKQKYLWTKEDAEWYEWFRRILTNAIKENQLIQPENSNVWWKQLNILLNSKEDYAARLQKAEDNLTGLQSIMDRASAIVVCGAGRRGASLVKRLKEADFAKYDRQILCADNNSNIWNTYLDGIKIESLDMYAQTYSGAYFIISNKLHASEIKEQLLSDGVKEEYIYEYNPNVNWD